VRVYGRSLGLNGDFYLEGWFREDRFCTFHDLADERHSPGGCLLNPLPATSKLPYESNLKSRKFAAGEATHLLREQLRKFIYSRPCGFLGIRSVKDGACLHDSNGFRSKKASEKSESIRIEPRRAGSHARSHGGGQRGRGEADANGLQVEIQTGGSGHRVGSIVMTDRIDLIRYSNPYTRSKRHPEHRYQREGLGTTKAPPLNATLQKFSVSGWNSTGSGDNCLRTSTKRTMGGKSACLRGGRRDRALVLEIKSRQGNHLTNACQQAVRASRHRSVHLTQQPTIRLWYRGLFDAVLSCCKANSEGSPTFLQLLALFPLGS
jgi:hypothetical protein